MMNIWLNSFVNLITQEQWLVVKIYPDEHFIKIRDKAQEGQKTF